MGDFDVAELRRRTAAWVADGCPWRSRGTADSVADMADDAADEIDRLRAELAAAKKQAADASGWLVALRYECNELRRAVDAWEAIAPGECFEIEEEGDVFHAVHKVLAALDAGRLTKAQRLSDAGDRRDWDECERIEAEDG
jgi:hypothetical protein